MKKANIAKIRKDVRERRDRECIRDSLALRGKPPAYSLKIMFELCDFLEKVNRGDGKMEDIVKSIASQLEKSSKFGITARKEVQLELLGNYGELVFLDDV